MMFEFPDKKWVIFVPVGLIPVWVEQMEPFVKTYGLVVKPEFIEYTGEQLKKFFSRPLASHTDSVIVLDEVHNLIPWLENRELHAQVDIIGALNQAYKIFALTGTPIYNDDSDLRLLINIVAGKTVLPVSESAYAQQFYDVDPKTAAIQGWVLPMLSKMAGWAQIPVGGVYGKKGLVILLAIMLLLKIYTKADMRRIDYMRPNVALLHNSYRPYLSYHEFSADLNFPTVKYVTNEVSYSNAQIEAWLKFAQGMLTPVELRQMGINPTVQGTKTMQDYISQGRVIGNLVLNDTPPPRFIKIKETIGNKDGIVVYSNFFKEGLQAFETFLGKEHSCRYLLPEDTFESRKKTLLEFKERKFRVLLLHPKLTEGIDILGATQMHVMEPLLEQGAAEQLHARVIRFHSHHHLPEADRIVTIFQWYALPVGIVDGWRKDIQSYKLWTLNTLFTWIERVPESFPSLVAPEGYLQNQSKRSEEFVERLIENLKRDSIDNDQYVGMDLVLERKMPRKPQPPPAPPLQTSSLLLPSASGYGYGYSSRRRTSNYRSRSRSRSRSRARPRPLRPKRRPSSRQRKRPIFRQTQTRRSSTARKRTRSTQKQRSIARKRSISRRRQRAG